MQHNLASWDRAVRAVVALALVAVAVAWASPWRWALLAIGVILGATAASGYCPLYGVCRFSTAAPPAGGQGRRP